MSEAALTAAVMGYGVICQKHGHFYLVWWEDDEQCSSALAWEECQVCGSINQVLEVCEGCMLLEDKVA